MSCTGRITSDISVHGLLDGSQEQGRAAIVITGNATVIPRIHFCNAHGHLSALSQKPFVALSLQIADTPDYLSLEESTIVL